MTKRFLEDDFWGDGFVQTLSCEGKLFYIYLFSNKHVKASGIYELTPRTAAFETGLPEENIPAYFEALKEKVVWRQQTGLVWVKNFVVYQCTNPNWLQGAVVQAASFSSKDRLLVIDYFNYLKLKLDSKPWMRITEALESLGEGYGNLLKGCSPVLSCKSNSNSPVLSDKGDTQGGKGQPIVTPEMQEFRRKHAHLYKKGVPLDNV